MIDPIEIEKIKQLKYRYFRALDTGDVEALRACFTVEATALFIGNKRAELQGRDAIVDLIMGHATNPNLITKHQGHHPEIDVSGNTAEGIWYLEDAFLDMQARTTARGTAYYKDRYVKEGEAWLIEHTNYERMYQETEIWDASKQVTGHFLERKKAQAK